MQKLTSNTNKTTSHLNTARKKMAPSSPQISILITNLWILLTLVLSSCINGDVSFRPKALALRVQKDSSTKQYLAAIYQRTPIMPIQTTLDLGGQHLWVDCDKGYFSSTYKPALCNSAQCKLARSQACIVSCNSPRRPGCTNNTCAVTIDNTVTFRGTDGSLGSDVVMVQATDGSNPGTPAYAPKILFGCAAQFSRDFLFKGLAYGVDGMSGFGRSKTSLPYQLSSAWSFPKKFALCLSSSTTSNGVVFFGDGPYVLLPNVDVSKSLTYTPLILNPVSTATGYFAGDPSSDYFIGVKSIKINNNPIKLNATLLSIDKEGFGGTKLSTVQPYTVMDTSIYKAFTGAFANAMSKVPRAKSVAPFGLCFDSKKIGSTRAGPAVPQIDLVLQSSGVYWRIFGANSMVQVSADVLCLGFVDGGERPRTSIVIGGHQLEDNLLQFDLAASRVGFSSTLLFRETTCANFNWTSIA